MCILIGASGNIHAFQNFQVNSGQTGSRRGLDINVEPVWLQGITGSGVVVSIVDDGGLV